MKILNKIAFLGFIVIGAMFFIAFARDYGNLLGILTFIGWFLMAYGLVTFIGALVVSIGGHDIRLYHDLYVANYGFALVAISAIALNRDFFALYVLLALVASLLGVLAVKLPIMRRRTVPMAYLAPVTLAAIIPSTSAQLGSAICQFVGIFCILISFATILSGREMEKRL